MSERFDQEEKEILQALEQDALHSVVDAAEQITQAQTAARETLNKSRRINLRLTERDYRLAQERALEEGMPYQTLLASVIHKYLTDRLVERGR